MLKRIIRKIKKGFFARGPIGDKYSDINPEDIFIDSTNLPGFESHRFEGRMEKPVGAKTFLLVKGAFALAVIALVCKLWILGVSMGPVYAEISENNRLERTTIFANRGIIYDRNRVELATNAIKDEESDFPGRLYSPLDGLSHVVGYLKYPLSDRPGVYYEENYRGRDGVELFYNEFLRGENGIKLREKNVFGEVISEAVIAKPLDGPELVLSVDAPLTEAFHSRIAALARERGFVGGAGVIMDVETGEIVAMTSFPEYDQNTLTAGADREAIAGFIESQAKPFLNRAIGGLYAPGSIIKPVIALAALEENLISPSKEILSTGSISVPNPYDASKPSVFGDWRAHGWTNMREAIAVSSDVYFYSIGGGFEDQKGLGITLIDRYLRLFGLTEKTGIELFGELEGIVPNPEWKKERFDGDIWRLGDTYITSIGQYGTLVTPLNAARFTAAIANKGKILKSSLLLGGLPNPVERLVEFDEANWQVIHGGMRDSVTQGTSSGLNVPYVRAAAKTGTAEIGAGKLYVHSWSIGFFPLERPRYAWAVIMERGPSANTLGATSVIRGLFDWMAENAPEYFL